MRKYLFILIILFLFSNVTFADVSCKARFACKHNCSGTAVCPNGEKLLYVTSVSHHRACYKGHRIQSSVTQSKRVSDSSWYVAGVGGGGDNRHDIVVEFICSGNSCDSNSAENLKKEIFYYYGNQNICGKEENAGSIGPIKPGNPDWVEEVKESSTDSCVMGQYISGYNTNWSNCVFNSITGATLKCIQTRGDITPVYLDWYGTYEYTYLVIGGVKGSSPIKTECVGGTKPNDALEPTKSETKTFNIVGDISASGDVYANNSDFQTISIIFSGTTNQNKPITEFPGHSFTNFSSNVRSNIIDGSLDEALAVTSTALNSSITPNTIVSKLYIKSVTPFDTTEGEINFNLGGTKVTLKDLALKFLKPFVGKIEVKNPTTGNWDGEVTLGTLSSYRLVIDRKENDMIPTSNIIVSDKQENKLKDTIKIYGNEADIMTLSGTKLLINSGSLEYGIISGHNIGFETRINTSSGAKTMPKNPGLQIDKATISYKLAGKDVKYYIGPDGQQDKATLLGGVLKATEIYPVTLQGGEFLGIRVIGGIQGGGNSEFTGQKQNISSISSMETRTQIRKNAYTYTNSMKSGDVVNGVKYVVGDIVLPELDMNYETLVVKNGNVIIKGNLNLNNTKLLGIIVLKDGYSVTEDWKNSGNVYVTPSVQKINAIIYADGGLISVGLDDKNEIVLYDTDSTTRTQQLNRQLYMNGSLFTRNTIGGAVLTNQTNEKYTLPGGAKTNDFNLALQYDLNYIRRGGALCESAGGLKPNQTPEKCNYEEPFIIKYDPRIQTTPPKLFKN